MLVSLIPFFLAANLPSQNVSSWPKGPEFEFELSAFCSRANPVINIFNVKGNVTFTITCQPKEPSTLSCKLYNGHALILFAYGDILSNSTMDNTIRFDMHFNENGCESVTTEEEMFCRKIGVLARIVTLFNVGTDLRDKPSDFEDREDSALGRCLKTNFHAEVNRGNVDDETEPEFELHVLPMSISKSNVQVDLTKVRDVKSCNGSSVYFTYMQLFSFTSATMSSVSGMSIDTSGTFQSYAEHLGRSEDSKDEETMSKLEEIFHIKLNSIKEATELIPPIEKPIVVRPFSSPCRENHGSVIL